MSKRKMDNQAIIEGHMTTIHNAIHAIQTLIEQDLETMPENFGVVFAYNDGDGPMYHAFGKTASIGALWGTFLLTNNMSMPTKLRTLAFTFKELAGELKE